MAKTSVTVTFGRRVKDTTTGEWKSENREKVFEVDLSKEPTLGLILDWCANTGGWCFAETESKDDFVERFFAE